MAQQRAVVKKIDDLAEKKRTTRSARSQKKSLSFSVKCDLKGTYEVSFEGTMTEPYLSANRFSANGMDSDNIERAYINLMGVDKIDDAGIDVIVQLMRRIVGHGIKFQLLYSEGQVSSKLESSGLMSYFAKPTWATR